MPLETEKPTELAGPVADPSKSTEHDQWIEQRRGSIGASEVPTVLGLNPFQTPLELWGRKTGKLPDAEETQAMRMGHRLEPIIADLYCEETGREVTDLGAYTIQRNSAYPFLHATLDRLVRPCRGRDMPGDLQIKTVGSHMAAHWEEDIPLYVQAQVQAEMVVAKLDWGSVAALIGGQQFVWHDVERSDSFIEYMTDMCGRFWNRIKRDEAPDAVADDTDVLKLLYPKHVPSTAVELTADAAFLDDKILELQPRIKAMSRLVDEAKNQLRQMIGDNEYGVLPNGVRWSNKSSEIAEAVRQAHTRRTLRRLKA